MTEYIEREAAEKVASKYGCGNGSTLDRHSGIADYIASDISKIPAADVAPVRHGKWMPDKYGGIYCSTCNKRPTLLVKTKYCPHCGSFMLEDEA